MAAGDGAAGGFTAGVEAGGGLAAGVVMAGAGVVGAGGFPHADASSPASRTMVSKKNSARFILMPLLYTIFVLVVPGTRLYIVYIFETFLKIDQLFGSTTVALVISGISIIATWQLSS